MTEEVLKRVEILLDAAPDAEKARSCVSQFIRDHGEIFDQIAEIPAALRALVAVFSYSNFLTEAILREPGWFLPMATSGDLHRTLSCEEFQERLMEFAGADGSPAAVEFARFRRRQILRIMLRDVLQMAPVAEIAEELSHLADAILEVALRTLRQDFTRRYGVPRWTDASGKVRECGFAVIALGKLGGRELNYSSDIDLMFLYDGNGETDGAESLSNKEFFKKVANRFTDMLSTYTAEGMCYRVDLRLRPDGTLGEVCISLDGAKNYYASRARDWELQMLIKARVCAGDWATGRALLDYAEPFIYSSTLDFGAVEALSATRQRIGERLAAKNARGGGNTIDVKLSPGGIRDIEFLVQCLQRLHGGREKWVRHGGTLHALSRLRDKNLLSGSEYFRLASAYEFLRNTEHRLQFLDDRQTHVLPASREELAILARKLPMGPSMNFPTVEEFEKTLRRHLSEVRELYERVIYAQKPMYYTPVPATSDPESTESEQIVEVIPSLSNLTRFLDHRAPGLASVLSRSKLHRGKLRFEHFLERLMSSPIWLDRLDRDENLAACAIEIFEYSPFFSDQLIRYPELIAEMTANRGDLLAEAPEDASELRRLYRREMVRLQAESIFRRVPIFKTLGQTSDLADRVIAAAYHVAIWQRLGTNPPSNAAYFPTNQMLVIALGRLGVREFDIGSDADLLFVIPDEDANEHLFWTGVAEAMIHLISAYTGDGVIFSVDTRLRPNGREGALVQTFSAYKEYFSKHAEAWEGISYMKSRAVAGDMERATNFLNELQDVDWRRWGQGGRSRKLLAEMRARLEREQGQRNQLKAGRGGYYDIDFVLMYLRLRGAGIFFKVLNTPERIDVIEKTGHLDREDAEFLSDAATFYRALDHAGRVMHGHTEGRLPSSQAQIEVLTELVHRWTPDRLHELSLEATLQEIKTRTSEYFHRVFS